MENKQEKTELRIERETVTNAHQAMAVKVWISKENLDIALAYAAMIKMDDPNCLFGELIKVGMKDIKYKLNNLPYVTRNELVERYQAASMNNPDTPQGTTGKLLGEAQQ